jgi:hypothetical protein
MMFERSSLFILNKPVEPATLLSFEGKLFLLPSLAITASCQ